MDEARLPFTMNATVSYGGSPPGPSADQLPAGWVRMPVSFQVTLPAEVMEAARQDGSSAGSGHGPEPSVPIVSHSLRLGAGVLPDDGRTRQDLDTPLRTSRDDPSSPGSAQVGQADGPISAGALNSLGLGAAFGQKIGNRAVDPVSFNKAGVSSAPTPPDAGEPSETAGGRNQPAAGTGQTAGATGNRVLDVVFNAGRIGTLHRAPPLSTAAARPADSGE